MLTLALGIGANAAIFTLVNALMLKNLPVTDPKTLIRLGNNNDCCVGIGFRDNGEYSYFTTDSYEYLRKNVPEFEELAAMQAGFAYRPVVVRRDNTEDAPRSVMGEFVSGNYFRTFGLSSSAGRLLEDRDDRAGVPLTAVMSYETWKTRFNGDASVVGSTFRVNTKPVTVVGIAPKGFYGDRLLPSPPEYYLPIETHAGDCKCDVCAQLGYAVAVPDRAGKTGCFAGCVAAEGEHAASAATWRRRRTSAGKKDRRR